MLTITIPAVESFDEVNGVFITSDATTLHLEHSLVSLSKWESEFKKPFLSSDEKTDEEAYGYVRAMTLDSEVPLDVYRRLSSDNLMAVNKYIEDTSTATWFKEKPNQRRSREIITGELIYYWMIALNIPLDAEHWHLNRLFTLIKVCNEKNQPEKKMSKQELAQRNAQINAQRLAKHNTTG